jgi:hypothetical protein
MDIQAVDVKPSDRPGVPMEAEPHRLEGAHWADPERQPPDARLTRRMELGGALTPCFGTAQPPSGLSGILRRMAYRVPEHRPKHTLLLMLADRVDVLEHTVLARPAELAKWLALLTPVAALGLLGVAIARRR